MDSSNHYYQNYSIAVVIRSAALSKEGFSDQPHLLRISSRQAKITYCSVKKSKKNVFKSCLQIRPGLFDGFN